MRQSRVSRTAPVLSGIFVGLGLLYCTVMIGPHVGLLPALTNPWWQTTAGLWLHHMSTALGAGLLALVALAVLDARWPRHRS